MPWWAAAKETPPKIVYPGKEYQNYVKTYSKENLSQEIEMHSLARKIMPKP